MILRMVWQGIRRQMDEFRPVGHTHGAHNYCSK